MGSGASTETEVKSFPLASCASALSYGGLAQLARAPALQAGGQRFESVILHSPFFGETFFDILTQARL